MVSWVLAHNKRTKLYILTCIVLFYVTDILIKLKKTNLKNFYAEALSVIKTFHIHKNFVLFKVANASSNHAVLTGDRVHSLF